MDSETKVTFIIPAYNVEQYLSDAVESVLGQTCQAWKMIIVDDCSSDLTLQIAQGYASRDPRIKVMKMESQSGGAYLPRKTAIQEADTPLVAPLDADDMIAPDYLENLLERIEKDDADAVYPMMYSLRGGETEYTHTPDISLIGKNIPGKDALAYTLDGWRIHCNGGLIKKEVYLQAFGMLDEREIEVKSYLDEYLTRLLLYNCATVAITDERYIFRENPESITHSRDIKAFGFLGNNLRLLAFVEGHYPRKSESYMLAHRQNFHGIADALRIMNRTSLTGEEKEKVFRMLGKCRKEIDYTVLEGKISGRYKALLSLPFSLSRPLLRLIDSLRF